MFEHPHHLTIFEEDVELPSGKVLPWLRYEEGGPDGVMIWEFPGGGTHSGWALFRAATNID